MHTSHVARSLVFGSLFLSTLLLAGCDDGDPFTAPGSVVPPAPTEPQPPPPPSQDARVAGMFVNAVTGDPLPGVVVAVGDVADTTGADGEFEIIAGEKDGPASLHAAADGFESFARSIWVASPRSVWLFALMPVDPSAFGAMGVYEFTAPITDHNPNAWLPMYGWYYTGILTLSHHPADEIALRGTITDWRENYPDAEPQLTGSCHDNVCVDNGVTLVTGSLSPDGVLGIDATPGSWRMEGTVVAGGDLQGTWSCCDHVSGTFTAVRRPAN